MPARIGVQVATRGAPMPAPKTPVERFEAIANTLTANRIVAVGKIFGMPSLIAHRKAFAGLYDTAMVFKLSGKEHARALALSGARLFDPSRRGRPMKSWVEVPAAHAERWTALAKQAYNLAESEHRRAR